MTTTLVKYGGAAMEDLDLCRDVSKNLVHLSQSGESIVVVHGGGKEISAELRKEGVEPRFINGLRYTDEATLRITEMMLSGLINKRLVSFIQQAGGRAVGLSGRDDRLALAKRVEVQKFGLIGEVESVSTELLGLLIRERFIPVLSPVSEDRFGTVLNVNADDMARAVAERLEVDQLIYLSDTDGLMLDGKVVERLTIPEAKALLVSPQVSGGMIPKLTAAIHALENGVGRVRFLNGTKPALLRDLRQSMGTDIVPAC